MMYPFFLNRYGGTQQLDITTHRSEWYNGMLSEQAARRWDGRRMQIDSAGLIKKCLRGSKKNNEKQR